MRLLHVAPEPMLKARLSRLEGLDYVTGDLDSPHADLRLDVTDLNFEDESFDAVICNHVLEHVPEDRRALSELNRVLRQGGWAVLMCPIDGRRASTYEDPSIVDPGPRKAAFGQRDHVRVYGRDYLDRLRDAGFEVSVRDYAAELSDREVERYGVVREGEPEQIYLAERRADH